jgi:hypothetical protein
VRNGSFAGGDAGGAAIDAGNDRDNGEAEAIALATEMHAAGFAQRILCMPALKLSASCDMITLTCEKSMALR